MKFNFCIFHICAGPEANTTTEDDSSDSDEDDDDDSPMDPNKARKKAVLVQTKWVLNF